MDFSKFWRRLIWPQPAKTPRERSMAQHVNARESRVGPRASAWVEGHNERARYFAPAGQGFPSLVLDYGLYLPPNPSAATLPLVVMLHGCTQSSDAFARGTRMNLLADRYGFAVLYPEQPAKRHAQTCWHWYDTRASAGGAEAHAIVALVDKLTAEHRLAANRVYVAGLSAGAGMAILLAVRYPAHFAALAVHSGVVFGAARSVVSALDAMRRGTAHDPAALMRAALPASGHPGMPTLLLHGECDEVVYPINVEQLEAQFLALNGVVNANGCVVAADLLVTEHGAYRERVYRRAGRDLVKVCLVAELGHAWSGGDDTVPLHAAIGPDASEEIWAFFREQQR